MRYELKSIGIWAYLKIAFFLNLAIGFIGGLFFALFLSFELAVMQNLGMDTMPGMAAEDFPFGVMLILFPILFAIGGAVFYTILGLIFVFIYNLVARLTGGFEMELRAVEPAQSDVVPAVPPQTQPTVPPPPPPPSAVPPPPPPPTQSQPSETPPPPDSEETPPGENYPR